MTKLARLLMGLYPVFLIGLFIWIWLSHSTLASLRDEYEEVSAEAEARAIEDRYLWGSEDDIQQLDEVIEEWHSKTGLEATDVPVLIEDVAKLADVRITDYDSRDKTIEKGYEFEEADITVTGTFTKLLSALSLLEKNQESFITIPSIAINPPRWEEGEKGDIELRARLRVMLDQAE